MILVNNPVANEVPYPMLRHTDWHGWSFADTIFPFFLWIIGVSLTFSTASRLQRGESRRDLLWHATQRSLLLFCCGVFLDNFLFQPRQFPFFSFTLPIQLTGVLQKISVCYLVAFVLFLLTDWRGVMGWIVTLSAIYLALMFFFPVPDCGAGVLTIEGNFAGYLDNILLNGHRWKLLGEPDPDGLGSMLSAITSVLFGILAGCLIRSDLHPWQRVSRLLMVGLALSVAGMLLSAWVIPINKHLWSTSYAFLMAGMASVVFAVWYWVIEIRDLSRWFRPFEIFGMNAIAAYIVSRMGANILKVHFFGTSFADMCLRVANGTEASLLFSTANVVGVFAVVWLMYRQRWFLKL